jgi:hypothetical protein
LQIGILPEEKIEERICQRYDILTVYILLMESKLLIGPLLASSMLKNPILIEK